MIKSIFLIIAMIAFVPTSIAVEPGEVLKDEALENRARALSTQIRCLVCQNQSIDDSNADLARDLRILVRERLVAGDSDQEILDYLSSRYGDFVLLNPPVKRATLVLWFGPLVLFIMALVSVTYYFRRRRNFEAPARERLEPDETKRLVELLEKDNERRQ